MTTNRTYGEGCAIAHALDLVGERWALLAIRELILGPKRFTDLRAGIPHVSPNVLAQRLRELEQAGIVRRAALPPPAGSRVYELTEWGRELEPALLALGSWGARSPLLPHDAGMSTDAQVLALRTVFDPAAAEGFEAAVELRLGGERFHARVAGGGFEIERGAALAPDAVIEADQAGLASVLWRGRRLAEAQRSGDVTIDGSETVAARFLTLFPAPTPAPG
jgi:DNA-binding HxlR family transcriptional regulator